MWVWIASAAVALAMLVPVLSVYIIGTKQALGDIRNRVESLLSELETVLGGADEGGAAARTVTDAELLEAKECFARAESALRGSHRPRSLRAAERWARRGLAVMAAG